MRLLEKDMRILVYGLNFPPEITGVGKYTGEMVSYLAGRGCQVRVVTAFPYYPTWKIMPEFSAHNYSHESWHAGEHAVEVFRCPLWVPAQPSGLKRILHLLSFTITSLPAFLSQAVWKPDLVFCIAPTILTAPAALITARISKAKTWLHLQDFEIGTAWSLGFLNGQSFLRGIFNYLFLFLAKNFDRVSTISINMLDTLRSLGIAENKSSLFPNWADTETINCSLENNGYRKDLNIRESDIVVLFSGSMTRKQSLHTVVEAAACLAVHKEIQFVLCGEGDVRNDIETMASGLPNVHFLPLQPVDKLNHLMNLADIHLLPQLSAAADLVMPSKTFNMLASGKPVIATVNDGTSIGELVKDAGILTPPEDAAALASAIIALAMAPTIRAEMGRKGRLIAENEFSASQILADFFASIQELIAV